jgi:hypothetical protein
VCGSRDASHARATCFPVALVVIAGRGHGPLRVLLAPLVAAFDALLGTVSSGIGRRLLVSAWGRFPAYLCEAGHDHLVPGGVLGGDATWLLERASKEFALFPLPRALLAATGQCAGAVLVSLAVSLRLIVSSLPSP